VILSAAGGETHDGLTLEAPQTAVATYSLTYPSNGTDIDLDYVINYSPVGLTPNEHAVGNAINAIQTAQISPAFAPIASALFFSPNAATLARTYDTLSGEGTAAAEQTAFMSNDLFLSAVSRETDAWIWNDAQGPNSVTLYGDHPLAYSDDPQQPAAFRKFGTLVPLSTPPRTWRLWYGGSGGYAKLSGNSQVGSASAQEQGGEMELGLDYELSPNYLIGVAGGYGKFGWGVADRFTSGTTEAGHVGIYGAARAGNFYADGTLAFDFFDNQYNRYASIPGVNLPQPGGMPIVIGGFNEQLYGHSRSYSASGYFESGYKYRFAENYEFKPFAALEFGALRTNGYGEQEYGNPTNIGLLYSGRTIISVPLMLGAELRTKFAFNENVSLTTWVRAAWRHELADDRSIQASFLTAPGFDFVVHGAEPSQNALRSVVGASLAISRNASLFASFDADVSTTTHVYAGSGGLRLSW
jgi:uncharacterized protein with beta-barrel porin domain